MYCGLSGWVLYFSKMLQLFVNNNVMSTNMFNRLDASAILLSLFFIYYAITSYVENRNPNLNVNTLLLGVAFTIACIVTFVIHGRKHKSIKDGNTPTVLYAMTIPLVIILCYSISFINHLAPGRTLGLIIGSLFGAYIASMFRVKLPSKVESYVAYGFVGVLLFFILVRFL